MSDDTSNNGGSIVAIVAIVILAGLALAFIVYALPMLQKNTAQPQGPSIEIKGPAPIQPTQPTPAKTGY